MTTDPLIELRRLLGEQWSPQWTAADAIQRACNEIERLRRDMNHLQEQLGNPSQSSRPEDGRTAVIEECAKVCDEIATAKPNSRDWMKWDDPTAAECARRIRALTPLPQHGSEPK